MSLEQFLKRFEKLVSTSETILDLGAGSGKYSQKIANLGVHVIAVDKKIRVDLGPSVSVKSVRIEKFIARDSGTYDGALLRNVIQFLDEKFVYRELIPWLWGHLREGGTVGIETFYQQPHPPFHVPVQSLYALSELHRAFASWEVLYVKQYERLGPDLQGTQRLFYITNLIARKRNLR